MEFVKNQKFRLWWMMLYACKLFLGQISTVVGTDIQKLFSSDLQCIYLLKNSLDMEIQIANLLELLLHVIIYKLHSNININTLIKQNPY